MKRLNLIRINYLNGKERWEVRLMQLSGLIGEYFDCAGYLCYDLKELVEVDSNGNIVIENIKRRNFY